MPELPEVETIRRQLAQALEGRVITAVELWKHGREFPAGDQFVEALVGRRIERIERRAKLLIWRFDNGYALTAHLKMTGRFLLILDSYESRKHDRVLFVFDDGTRLVWSDIRQFGFLKLVSQAELEKILEAYGPEPLDVSLDVIAACFFLPKTRLLKAALLDQTTLAGVGNIYADEACHRAGLLPTRRLGSLTDEDRLRLAQGIQNVLHESLKQKGTSANDYVDTQGARGGFLELLRVYGRKGEPCRTCKTPIVKMVLAQRGTHYCPACQR